VALGRHRAPELALGRLVEPVAVTVPGVGRQQRSQGVVELEAALQRVFLGPLNPKYATLEEINAREIFCLAPLGILVMAVGVWPMPLLNLLNASAVRLVDLVKAVI